MSLVWFGLIQFVVDFFSMLANLLQCDVMLLIMHTVLKRAIDLKARSFSESHLQKVRFSFLFRIQISHYKYRFILHMNIFFFFGVRYCI